MRKIFGGSEKAFNKRYWFLFAVIAGSFVLCQVFSAVGRTLDYKDLSEMLRLVEPLPQLQLLYRVPNYLLLTAMSACVTVVAIRWNALCFAAAYLFQAALLNLSSLYGNPFIWSSPAAVRAFAEALIAALVGGVLLFVLAKGFAALLKEREWGTFLILVGLRSLAAAGISLWYVLTGSLPMASFIESLMKAAVNFGLMCGAYALLRLCLNKWFGSVNGGGTPPGPAIHPGKV